MAIDVQDVVTVADAGPEVVDVGDRRPVLHNVQTLYGRDTVLASLDKRLTERLAGRTNVELVFGDALTIDDYLIERPSQTVLIRVKGDSMVDAGILEGDLVVVEKTPSAKRGDIVVAIVDGQFTLKRLDTDRGQFVLKPENKAYPVIRAEGALEIFGSDLFAGFEYYRNVRIPPDEPPPPAPPQPSDDESRAGERSRVLRRAGRGDGATDGGSRKLRISDFRVQISD